MDHKKTIADLMEALTESLSDREVAKAVIKSNIANAIIAARVASGLSQSELAASIGKTQSTISKWENGSANFSIDMLVDIAADMDLDLTISLNRPAERVSYKRPPQEYRTPQNKIINFNFSKTYYSPCGEYVPAKEM